MIYEVKVVRAVGVKEDGAPMLTRADLAADFFREIVETAAWFDPEKECVVVLVLNRKHRLLGYNLVSLGCLTSSLVHPREVFRPVIVAAGSAFILCHNHPGGDPAPSSADVQVTKKIRSGAEILDIDFLDHVVVGRPAADPIARGYYSFREAGLL